MSKNYKNYSKQSTQRVSEAVEVDTEVQQAEVVETEVVPAPAAPVTGVVANCTKLNVRKTSAASAPVVSIINEGVEVRIGVAESTDDFYKVYLASGVEGFCMKKFITVKQ